MRTRLLCASLCDTYSWQEQNVAGRHEKLEAGPGWVGWNSGWVWVELRFREGSVTECPVY